MQMNKKTLTYLLVVASWVSAADHECYKLIANIDNKEYSVETEAPVVERSAYLRDVISQNKGVIRRAGHIEIQVPVESESQLRFLKELCELKEKNDVYEYLLDPNEVTYTGYSFQHCEDIRLRRPDHYQVGVREPRYKRKLLKIADLSKRFAIKQINDLLGYVVVDEGGLEQYCKERQLVDEQKNVQNHDTQQCVVGLAHIRDLRIDRIPVTVSTWYNDEIDGRDGGRGSYDDRWVPRHFLLKDLMDMELAFHMQAEGIEFFMRPITTKTRTMALRYLSKEWDPNDLVINYARRTIFLEYKAKDIE